MNVSKYLGCVMVLAVVGCQGIEMPAADWDMPSFDWRSFRFRPQSPDGEDLGDFETKVETPMIGDYVTVTGLNLITLQGVGLVTGLPGTGSDPPPSPFRTTLYRDMKRRGVSKPNRILKDRSTALVIVRAYLPPLIKKRERFDVEVRVPGDSETTSLNGGWLMETYLSEQAIVPGQGVLEGRVFAKVKGPGRVAFTGDSVQLWANRNQSTVTGPL